MTALYFWQRYIYLFDIKEYYLIGLHFAYMLCISV